MEIEDINIFDSLRNQKSKHAGVSPSGSEESSEESKRQKLIRKLTGLKKRETRLYHDLLDKQDLLLKKER